MKLKFFLFPRLFVTFFSLFLHSVEAEPFDIYHAIQQGEVDLVQQHLDLQRIDKVLAYAASIKQINIIEMLLAKKGETALQDNFIFSLQNKKKRGEALSITQALFLKWSLYRSGELALSVVSIDKANRGYAGFHKMINALANIELEMDQRGYVTFVHGRNWQWNFVNSVWNIIASLEQGYDSLSTEISVRFRGSDENVEQLLTMRKELLDSGVEHNVTSCTHLKGKESELLFMNRTALSNLKEWGECSGRYFLQDHSTKGSIAGWDYTLQLLNKYDLLDYLDDFQTLYIQHQALTEFGELLCISIQQEELDNFVYPAYPGGVKTYTYYGSAKLAVEKHSHYQTLQESNFFDDGHDNQTMIYCFAVPNIPGDSQSSYQLHSLHMADEQQYAEYLQQVESLFKKIRKSKKKR